MMPVAAVRICRGHLLSPTYCIIGAHAIQSKFLREKKRRILVSPREEPCVSCVPGISEPSFVCVSQNPFLLTRATDVAGDTAFSMHVFHVDYSVHD